MSLGPKPLGCLKAVVKGAAQNSDKCHLKEVHNIGIYWYRIPQEATILPLHDCKSHSRDYSISAVTDASFYSFVTIDVPGRIQPLGRHSLQHTDARIYAH